MDSKIDQAIVLGAGPLGMSLASQLAERGEEVRLFSVMNNPAYDMPGKRPPGSVGSVGTGTGKLAAPAPGTPDGPDSWNG